MKIDTFTFEGLAEPPFQEPELSNTEREMIRQLAGPDQPLHRIQAGMLDYARLLRDNLMRVDVSSDEGRLTAMKIQAEHKAVIWQYQFWERILTIVREDEEEET